MFWPTLNSSVMRLRPRSESLDISTTPSMPASSSSRRLVISRSTSSGEVPRQEVVTLRTGRRTSGVS